MYFKRSYKKIKNNDLSGYSAKININLAKHSFFFANIASNLKNTVSMYYERHIIRGFFLLLYSLSSILLFATSNADIYRFKSVFTSVSFPTNEVRKLYQDSQGYIWIATYNGLLRYDGYSILTYRPDGIHQDHSIDGFVNTVIEDKENRLWIGTHNGLYVLHRETDEIEKDTTCLLQASNIEALFCTSNGDLWVGSSLGLFCRKSDSTSFQRINSTDVKSMIEDKRGYIWFGTWKQGLLRYDPREDRFYTYKGIDPEKSPHAIFQDENENIWVGTWLHGLIKLVEPYDEKKNSFEMFVHDDNNPSSLLDNIIYSITQDKTTGKIWISSRSGVSILENEQDGGTFTNITPGNQQGDLPFNEVNSLLCSNDGLMWLGMLGGGVCTVNTTNYRFNYDPLKSLRNHYPTSSVRCIYQEDNGDLWLGIMGFGLVTYEPSKQVIVPYKKHPILKEMGYTSTVNDIIYRSKSNELCFATWDDGVWFYDKEKRKAYTLNSTTNPALKDVCIYSLLEDSKGNLWMGTRSGVFVLDTQNELHALNELLSPTSQILPRTSIFKMAEDKEGMIWLATNNGGVWRIDTSQGKFQIKFYTPFNGLLSTAGVMTVCVDGYGRIWVGTNGNGLNLYDKENDCFIPVLNDYFQNGDVVFSLLEDNKNSLWLTTNAEMFHISIPLNDSQPRIQTYTVDDGLQDRMFNRNSCFKSNDGKLLFGGVRGLNSFYPEEIRQDSVYSPIVITDIKIHNISLRNLPSEERRTITGGKAIDFAKEIILGYQDNNFSLDFSLLNYVNSELNRYIYKLEGYDPNWLTAETGRSFAYYNNLPSGTYIFYVKGADQNGLWSPDIKQLRITILPPPWLSWWAYMLYALLLIFVIGYIYWVVRNRIRMRQTIEMGKIERQKIEEVNHAKLQFFTNITHELLTPLSIISASVDELKQEVPASLRLCQTIENNSTRLIRLIQQILEFRKVENGKIKLKVTYGNVSLFIKKSVSSFAPLVKKKKLSVNLEQTEECFGYFDIDKLDKIIYNLLSNAAKYTPEGGVITICQTYDRELGFLKISVNNPGEYIPKEKQEHLFERFYEGEYRKFHTIGTGIGLSLTKDLVVLHHGTIQVFSDKEEGNTFIVEIPIVRASFKEEECDESTEYADSYSIFSSDEIEDMPDTEIVKLDSNNPTLLLVEDNEELLVSMVRLLRDKYKILQATNGVEALKVLEKEEVHLIISDIMMPEMDGVELCCKVKEKFETCHIPVILLTAKISDEDQVVGYQSGADGYICKPLRLSVLLAKIDNLLKKSNRMGIDFRKQLVFEAKELNYTSMDEAFIQKAIDCVNAHLDDYNFEHAKFMAEMGMARTTLADKLKLLTGFTPSGFINNVRLQAACRLIDEKKKIRVSDLAYAVGFSEPKYFSLCFKKKFGLTPTEYMMRYES